MNGIVVIHVKNTKKRHGNARDIPSDQDQIIQVVWDLSIEHLVIGSDVLLVNTPHKDSSSQNEQSCVDFVCGNDLWNPWETCLAALVSSIGTWSVQLVSYNACYDEGNNETHILKTERDNSIIYNDQTSKPFFLDTNCFFRVLNSLRDYLRSSVKTIDWIVAVERLRVWNLALLILLIVGYISTHLLC